MRNKYISTKSNKLLSYFNEQNKNCFDYSTASSALPQSSESALRELFNLTEKEVQELKEVLTN